MTEFTSMLPNIVEFLSVSFVALGVLNIVKRNYSHSQYKAGLTR